MLRLPSSLAAEYRPATDREVRSWSFGVVKAPRDLHANSWEGRRGTLEDQAIFGTVRDLQCACGKYEGDRYRGMVCDRCGVKVTTQEARRQRFGHINLPGAIVHPVGEGAEHLSAVSVLPAAYWQTQTGSQLVPVYDELARIAASGCIAPAVGSAAAAESAANRAAEFLAAALAHLFDILLPVATIAHEWDLAEAPTLARGLCLEHRESSGSS